MKLYIRQKVFSWKDKFTVKDEAGNDRYFVEGEIFSWGHKLHVNYPSGMEAAFIHEKVWSWRPRYFVAVNGQDIAQIVKEFTFFKPRYYIEGLDWEVNGSFWAHDYEITSQGCTIVTIRKEWMTWGDSYVLDIADPQNELLALAVVLTIDCVMASQAAASSAN